ncbi:MAG: cysteine--tRNA ligase [Alphaproteobacteria bacterium]|nr:cysteine--tRNA ligase [Alphaproteobacteria bacterium]
MAALTLFNSLTRKKEAFEPLDKNNVRLYACGPTVYNYAHIGNARMAVVFDTLTRVLRTLYPKVTYVSNITDVDDKIIAAHRETGQPIETITEKYTKIYNEDMASLGVAPPDIQPRATTHIGEMIKIIEDLIARDHAYAADGHVLFHVPSFPAYGGLSGRSRDEQIAGARVEVASYKKDPADFVLWKPSGADEPGWDSPWGYGRPGWHIECSAMSAKHLGLPFDIHGGGADLKFPHHENEIAQSCCASGHEDDLSAFAKVWVHNGFVTVEGEKMSKSLGNFTLVHDILEDYPGPVIRLALLSAHYRKPLDWTQKRLQEAQRLSEKIADIFGALDAIECDPSVTSADADILAALCDDLNTPLAFSKLNTLLSKIDLAITNPKIPHKTLAELKSILYNSTQILGIGIVDQGVKEEAVDEALQTEIEKLLTERTAAKAAKNFARADEIRDELNKQGIEIIDTPEGPNWRKT